MEERERQRPHLVTLIQLTVEDVTEDQNSPEVSQSHGRSLHPTSSLIKPTTGTQKGSRVGSSATHLSTPTIHDYSLSSCF